MSKKYTCGSVDPTGCLLYTGEVPSFITDPACNLMLDSLLESYGDNISDLLSTTNLTALDKKCLDFNPATVSVKGLHQVEINKLCELDTRLLEVEAGFAGLSIANKVINIDLGALTATAAPCAQSTHNYTLITLLTIIFNELNQIKSQL